MDDGPGYADHYNLSRIEYLVAQPDVDGFPEKRSGIWPLPLNGS
jgi:hypothetical protein